MVLGRVVNDGSTWTVERVRYPRWSRKHSRCTFFCTLFVTPGPVLAILGSGWDWPRFDMVWNGSGIVKKLPICLKGTAKGCLVSLIWITAYS